MKKEEKKDNAQKAKKGKEQGIEYFQDPKNYVNRELSWLEFDCRVLEEARDRHGLSPFPVVLSVRSRHGSGRIRYSRMRPVMWRNY